MYCMNTDIPGHLFDCVMRQDNSGIYKGKMSHCHALKEMYCATCGKCKFYASKKTHYIRKADGFICEKGVTK